jgi:hypothetical protein
VRINARSVLRHLHIVVDDALARFAVNGEDVFVDQSYGIGPELDAVIRGGLRDRLRPGVNTIEGAVVNAGGPTLLLFETQERDFYGSRATKLHLLLSLGALAVWFALFRVANPPRPVVTILILLGMTTMFQHGLLRTLPYYGRGDWDVHLSFVESVRRSVVEYANLPLWNPYLDGGVPLLGFPESMAASPTIPLTWIMGSLLGSKILVVLHTWIGTVGMFFLCRSFGLRWEAALSGAVLFQFNGAIVQHLAEGHLTHIGTNWVPWSLLFFFRSRYRWNWNLLASGIFLAAVMLTGNVYTVVFTIVGISFWCVFESLRVRTVRPLLALCGVLAAFAAFSAPKSLAVMEYGLLCARSQGITGGFNIDLLWTALTGRELAYFRPGQVQLWHEYASYIGVSVLALSALGAASTFHRSWPAAATLGVLLWISMSGFAPLNAWELIGRLPLVGSLIGPSRWNYAFLFVLVWLAVLGVNRIGRAIPTVGFFIPYVIFADLFVVSAPLYVEAFRVAAIPAERAGPYRLMLAVQDPHPGRYSGQFEVVSANVGIRDSYNPVPPIRYAIPEDSAAYKGLVSLAETEGTAEIVAWAPRRITVRVHAESQGLLVYNQNYFPGWYAEVHGTRKRAFPVSGLVATAIEPADSEVVLVYSPGLVWAGLTMTTTATVLVGWTCLRKRRPTSAGGDRRRFLWPVAAAVMVGTSGEIAARWLGQASSVTHVEYSTVRLSEDPELIYEAVPGAMGSGVGSSLDGSAVRDDAARHDGTGGVFRLAFVGAGFTVGDGVRPEDTYPRLIESQLTSASDASGAGTPVEVTILGVPGYRPTEIIRLVRRAVEDNAADAVVVAIGEPFLGRRYELFEQLGQRVDVDTAGFLAAKLDGDAWLERVLRHSHLATLLQNRFRQRDVVLGRRIPFRLREYADAAPRNNARLEEAAGDAALVVVVVGAAVAEPVAELLNLPGPDLVRVSVDPSAGVDAHRATAAALLSHPSFRRALPASIRQIVGAS